MKDKISDADKASIESALEELKGVKDGDDVAAIKDKTQALTNAFYKISEELYKAQGAEAGADNAQEDVVDADYEVVDEDEE